MDQSSAGQDCEHRALLFSSCPSKAHENWNVKRYVGMQRKSYHLL